MNKPKGKASAAKPEELFGRIVTILEQARGAVVRAVNTNMVLAYWLIGREIVEEVQRGKGRAKYGEKLIDDLSARLKARYGKGFSTTNLRYFRTFYTVYADRVPEIRQIGSGVLPALAEGLCGWRSARSVGSNVCQWGMNRRGGEAYEKRAGTGCL